MTHILLRINGWLASHAATELEHTGSEAAIVGAKQKDLVFLCYYSLVTVEQKE